MSEQPVGEWPDVPARSGVEVVLGAADRVTGAVAACSEAPMTADPRTVIRDKVATAIERARGRSHPGLRYSQHLADAAIAAYLEADREARTITTIEQLDAPDWPVGTVIQEMPADDLDFYPQLWEMAFQCGWTRAGRKYDPDDETPTLPARVLHRPGGDAPLIYREDDQ